jgi:hypothetical protein
MKGGKNKPEHALACMNTEHPCLEQEGFEWTVLNKFFQNTTNHGCQSTMAHRDLVGRYLKVFRHREMKAAVWGMNRLFFTSLFLAPFCFCTEQTCSHPFKLRRVIFFWKIAENYPQIIINTANFLLSHGLYSNFILSLTTEYLMSSCASFLYCIF